MISYKRHIVKSISLCFIVGLLKFCLVSGVKVDIYSSCTPTMEWDTETKQAIYDSHDLRFLSQETQPELLCNKKNLLNSWFLVSKTDKI